MEWFFQLGIKASGWATAEIAKTWLNEEQLFDILRQLKWKH